MRKVMRILITGDPNWSDYGVVSAAVKDLWREHKPLVLIHTATGSPLDVIVQSIANDKWDMSVTAEPVAAQHMRDRADADRVRNELIIERGVDHCLVFGRPDANAVWFIAALNFMTDVDIQFHELAAK